MKQEWKIRYLRPGAMSPSTAYVTAIRESFGTHMANSKISPFYWWQSYWY